MKKDTTVTSNTTVSSEPAVTPVLKWAGGKTQLLDEIRSRMPQQFNRYYEPFLGGAAVYLAMQPQDSTLNDVNTNLMNVYTQLKNKPDELIQKLQILQDAFNSQPDREQKDRFYYTMRDRFNQSVRDKEFSVFSAALFIFLNKSCYNGLYRENRRGEFNVPSGKKNHLKVCEPENLRNVSRLLQKAILLNGDFENACETAEKNDFIFFDPPCFNTIGSYQTGGFTEADHRRLASLVDSLTARGVMCMMTNIDTDFIRSLYGSYHIDTVSVRRNLCCDEQKRTGTGIIITNYRTTV